MITTRIRAPRTVATSWTVEGRAPARGARIAGQAEDAQSSDVEPGGLAGERSLREPDEEEPSPGGEDPQGRGKGHGASQAQAWPHSGGF